MFDVILYYIFNYSSKPINMKTVNLFFLLSLLFVTIPAVSIANTTGTPKEKPVVLQPSGFPVPLGSSLTICLTGEAVDGMMVRIYPVSGGLPIEQMLIAGQSEAVINTGNLLPGYYVVALMRNGQVLQSLQVVK